MQIDLEQVNVFRTYFHYIISLEKLFHQEYPSIKDLSEKIVLQNGFSKIKNRKSINKGELKKALHLSWHTEMLIKKELEYPRLMQYALPWSMIQSYYSIYKIIRAYFIAQDREITKKHSATINSINSDLITCKNRFLPPWCCTFEGDPTRDQPVISNLKNSIDITLKNSLHSPLNTDAWQYFGLILKTTHSRKVSLAIDTWKTKNNRRKIFKEERQALISKQTPTTIFDFFQRLRLRSNYQDIELFLVPFMEQGELLRMQEALSQVISYTLCLFECMIIKAVGDSVYKEILESSIPPTRTVGVSVENMAIERWIEIKHNF